MKWLADSGNMKRASLVSAVEKLSQDVRQLKEDISYSPPAQTRISAVRSKHSSALERGYGAYTPRGSLWFYLRDHGEDMRKWDGKPTSTLRAHVHELQGKTVRKRDSSRKNAAPVSTGQPPRSSGRPDRTYDPLEGTSKSFLQEMSSEYGANCYHNGAPAVQYRTDRDSLVPIHKLIRQLEGQGVISRTHSPFNSPIWPVRKSNGEWRLMVDYRGLNEVTPLMSAAVPDMLELQYELESKAAKWYATTDIATAFFSIPLAAECRPQFAFTWRGVQYTWNRLPQGWKHSPTICHGLIQTALEKGEAPEHLQYIDDIIVWGNSAEEVSEKGKKIIQLLLQAGFAIK
ncbi:hypothetical protein GRJ2_002992200 [Grus japonensis]|uniref:ribonuclease H n=1 Tax=Grus japonensis TaxID=30415 RepID=A0ABC9Y680_GRUJA